MIHLYISRSVSFSSSEARMACAISEEYENGGRRRLRGGLTISGATGIKDSDTICCLSCCCWTSERYCLTEATRCGCRKATGMGGGYSTMGEWVIDCVHAVVVDITMSSKP